MEKPNKIKTYKMETKTQGLRKDLTDEQVMNLAKIMMFARQEREAGRL